MKVVVTPQEYSDTPSSDILYGNFIELGYGLQVEAMWGELLFNRSFEPFFPYRWDNKEWFDLWLDPTNWQHGFKTDWSKEDWYHSGYAHDAWFAAPGDEPRMHIDDQSTFIVNSTPHASVTVERIPGGSHGTHCLQVTNKETTRWAGVAQGGKYLKAGEKLTFRGQFCAVKGVPNVRLLLFASGEWENPLAGAELQKISDDWETRWAVFSPEKTGWATFCLFIPPQTSILIDDFTLMRGETLHGWRLDALEVIKQVRPGVIRFPGGCFASFYNWRDGIGPHQHRPPQPSYFWGGMNYNDVGVAELAVLCKEVRAEMMYCVNMYHPLKQKYHHYFSAEENFVHGRDLVQFTSIEQGAQDAADLVAYCNLPAGVHPMADLRAQHGYPEPFGIRFWELDNEITRWFTPEEYARAVVIYSRAMKAVDPSICIGLSSYGERPGCKEVGASLPEMLQICGRDIDFLADRRIREKELDEMLERMQAYNRSAGTHIRYCETEWLPLEEQEAYKDLPYTGYKTKSFMFSKWFYAMNIFRGFMMWQRKGGAVWYINFNNLANTHSQCVVDTPREGAFVTASGKALRFLVDSPARRTLKTIGYTPGDDDNLILQAAWDLDRQRMVLYAFNRTAEAQTVSFDLSQFDRPFRLSLAHGLSADSPLTMNTLKHPDGISTVVPKVSVENNVISMDITSYTFIEVILE